jgi:MFS transporter, DHA2 family, multidrug resistance protein
MAGTSAVQHGHGHEHYEKSQLIIVVMCSMAGTLMQALDTTIANVALPYMRGSLSASQDQITWVLTSYIVAAAVMTAPVGWLAARFGKKNILLVSMMGFTIASMLCGAATDLTEIVLFRLLQGVFGAALAPLSQAVMIDLYPIEKRAQVMAIWGIGIMLGPILGPTLGGFLTDAYSWRWVFYVNAPFGIAATLGLWLVFKDTHRNETLKFDWSGFGFLALAMGSLQLMLDRGNTQDWFGSFEIVIYAVLTGLGMFLFMVHMMTAEKPFLPRQMFKDRNFTSSIIVMFVVGAVLLASSALMPPYLQTLGGYSVLQTGLLLGPRGFGTIAAMLLVGKFGNKWDPRILMSVGTACVSFSLWQMAQWTPSIAFDELLVVSIIQGFGFGMVFSPLNLVTFATLPGQFRTDGSAFANLVRNVGSAIGVSVSVVILTNSMQAIRADLVRHASPFNRALAVNGESLFFNIQLPVGQQGMEGMISLRAAIEAYANDFLAMSWLSLLMFPLIWMMQRPSFTGAPKEPKKAPDEASAPAAEVEAAH